MTENYGDPWYRKGVKFKCTSCGKCCTGSGVVVTTLDEIEKMANYSKMPFEIFFDIHCQKINGLYYLKDSPGQDSCIFLKDKLCSIYEVRPKQCKTFPYWPSVLRTKEDWDNQQSYCEGINHPEGELVFPKDP